MAIREEKETKGIQTEKEVKLSLFANDMILSIENSKDANRKLLELINESVKPAAYKSNAQKDLAYLNTNNKRSEREVKEIIPFITATKIGITLLKEAKHLHLENCKILMKEMKDDTNRWRDTPRSRIRRIKIVKMTILPESNLQNQCNHYQIINSIFHRIRTKSFTICMDTRKIPNSQSNLENENRAEGIRFPDFRLTYNN